MTDIINFLINNRDNWLPLLLVSAIVTAILSFQYFFIYAYIINRRLKNPEKKHRLKLIMPRFACIVFAIIALLGTAKFLPGGGSLIILMFRVFRTAKIMKTMPIPVNSLIIMRISNFIQLNPKTLSTVFIATSILTELLIAAMEKIMSIICL